MKIPYRQFTGVWLWAYDYCNQLIYLVAGEGFEPSTFGL